MATRSVGGLAVFAILACTASFAPPLASAAVPGSIEGKVTSAAAGHAGIVGAEVCAYEVPEFELEGCEETDSSGEYTISNLPAGGYKVAFFANFAGLNYITQFYNGKSTFAAADPVTVTAGSSTANVNAEMHEGGRIEGKVTDAVSHAATQAVEVCALTKETFEFVACAYPNANGEYILAGLPSGEYKLEFYGELSEGSEASYITQFYNGKATYAAAEVIAVSTGATVTGKNAQMVRSSTLWPVSTEAPRLSGTPTVGSTLFCSTGAWGNGPTSYAYKWLRGSAAIAGQASSTYLVQGVDVNQAISCQVTAFNSHGSRTAASNALQVSTTSPLPTAPSPAAPKKIKRLKCRKGFEKKKVHGKTKCVKKKGHHKKHR